MKYDFTSLLRSALFLLFFTGAAFLQAQDCCCDNGATTIAGFGDCFFACLDDFGVGGGDCVAVPVVFSRFDGAADKATRILLQWTTATESDNSGFEVERADASMTWRSLGFVEGQGTRTEASEYSFLDRMPFIGNNFYRLKQVDFSGEFAYSEVISVSSEGDQEGIATVFPTVAEDELYIRYRSEAEAAAVAAIYSINGKLVRQLANTTSVIDVSDLESGQYVVVFTHKGKTYTERFIRR